jgi:hypothetical protein
MVISIITKVSLKQNSTQLKKWEKPIAASKTYVRTASEPRMGRRTAGSDRLRHSAEEGHVSKVNG